MKNLFSQQQDGYQSSNERLTRAHEGIWKEVKRIADELTTMNKRGRWEIDDLIARDVAATMNATINKQIDQRPKGVSELPVDEWSEEQKESVRWQLRNRRSRYEIQKNPVWLRWVRWNWNRFVELKRMKQRITREMWAQETGFYKSMGNTNFRRDLISAGVLTRDEYDNLKKVQL